jgi:hypothetical protein
MTDQLIADVPKSRAVRGSWEVLTKAGLGKSIVLGTFLSSLSLYSLLNAVLGIQWPDTIDGLFEGYRAIRDFLFQGIGNSIGVSTPNWLRDIAVLWSASGVIGGAAFLWIIRLSHEGIAAIVRRAEEPANAQSTIAVHGKEWYDTELENAKRERDKMKPPALAAALMVILRTLAGPLFFARIWWTNPPVIGTTMNGRHIALLYAAGHVLWLAVFVAIGMIANLLFD